MNSESGLTPLDVALCIARCDPDEISQSSLMEEIAFEMACEGNFIEALSLCDEIRFTGFRLKALLGISLEMLRQGEQKGALKTLRVIIKTCRGGERRFLYEEVLGHLGSFQIPGKRRYVNYILSLALKQAQQESHGGEKLYFFMETVKALAIHWREKVEEVVDCLLDIPLGNMDMGAGSRHDGRFRLCELALVIRKHGLKWDKERQGRFLRHFDRPEK